ncbi:MAG: hypothetical protein QOH05_2858 [Acetobacteraceae bacterium]|jgi:hypothetical protein|nr:hypothetical protein [Acetobacteraceae bacterium]
MLPGIMRIVAGAFVLVLCRGAVDQGQATVVRDNRTAPANPAVEAGGHHPRSREAPYFPYSLIGAIASESQWCVPIIAWPWRLFGSASRSHDMRNRIRAVGSGERPFDFPPWP